MKTSLKIVIFLVFLAFLTVNGQSRSGNEYSQHQRQLLNGLINEVGYNSDQHLVENAENNSKALVVGITVCLAFIFAIAGIFIGIYFHVDDVVPCMNKLVGTSKQIQRLLQDDADDKKSLVGEDRWDVLSEQNNGFVHSCPAEAYPMRKCIQDKAYKSPHAPRKQTTSIIRDPALEPIVNITSRSHSGARSMISDQADTISLLSWKSGTSRKSWKSQHSGRSARSSKSAKSAKSARSSKSGKSYRSSSSKRSSKSAKSTRSKSSDTISQHSFYLTDSQSVTGIPGATMMGATDFSGSRVGHTTGAGSSFATGSGNSGSGFGGGLSGIGSGYHANVSGSTHGSSYGGSIHDNRSEHRSRLASHDRDDTMSLHSHSSRTSRSSRKSKKSIGSSIGKRLRSRSRSRSQSRDEGRQEDDVKFHAWGKYVNSEAGEDILF